MFLRIRSLSPMHPFIDFCALELPEAPDPMPWQTLVRDPRVDRVLADAEVLGNLVN
jgi:hypothetical protein